MSQAQHQVFHCMGMAVHLTLLGVSAKTAQAQARSAEQIFQAWDQRFSRFREDSELNIFNQHSGQWHKVSSEFFAIIEKTLLLAESTSGVFDPSVGSVLAAAGYGLPKSYSLPLAVPTFRDISLNNKDLSIKCAPRQILEPAAIVKGLAIDAAATALSDVSGWMINASGDMLTHGAYGAQDYWNVAVQHPDNPKAIVVVVKLKDQAMATSGTYQTTWQYRNQQWQHQINLAQGQPTAGLKSVTVIAATAEQADTAASIALLSGLQSGQAYLQALGLPYLFIDDANMMHQNKLFSEHTSWLPRGAEFRQDKAVKTKPTSGPPSQDQK